MEKSPIRKARSSLSSALPLDGMTPPSWRIDLSGWLRRSISEKRRTAIAMKLLRLSLLLARCVTWLAPELGKTKA